MKRDMAEIGQMFLIGFDGTAVDRDHAIVQTIIRDRLGGVILFDRNVDGSRQNIQSPDQLRDLTASLQEYAEIPLLVAVDQEGGRVCRLKEVDGFPPFDSAGLLGSRDRLSSTRDQAATMAETLAASGINFNLAPVVDLDINPENMIISRYERSYGIESERVVRHAGAFIEAHHKSGVACCLKHFPGHGSSTADSHLGFVDISDGWNEEELDPYKSLFASGFGDAVMTAHVVNRNLDREGLPATLSNTVVSGLLQQKLGFKGVTVSDDLQMKAICDHWDFEEAVQKAVLAGVDLIIVGNNLIRQENPVVQGIKAVSRLLDSGRISEDMVCAALDKIMTLKRKIAGETAWTVSQPTT